MSSPVSATVRAVPPQPAPPPRRARVGRALLVAAAVVTTVVPVLLDAVVLAGAHMDNPAWLPHAKLHAALSFLTGIALGVAALVCLLGRPVTDRFAMTLGAFLSCAFYVCLIAAGAWPGTSYEFAGDPVYGTNVQPHPFGVDVPLNVATALVVVLVAVVGLVLVRSAPAVRASVAPETGRP